MEQFQTIKRRASVLVQDAQKNLPSVPGGLKRRTTVLLQDAQQNLPAIPKLQWNRDSQQQGLKGTWERIDITSLPRSSHSLNVISGSAYIFGGEINPREPVDNDMHVIRLPYSSAGADYYKIKATAAKVEEQPNKPENGEALEKKDGTNLDEVSLDFNPYMKDSSESKGKERAVEEKPNVPEPRVGHATAVIGSRIFLFGGRGGPDMKPLEEGGRVWVFDTRTSEWSFLDPAPAVKGGAIVPHPPARSYHSATAVDRPREFASAPAKKPQNWREWALGDTSKTGIPQDPLIGHIAEDAVDEESLGYGTFFVHAGCLASGDRTSDLWAFDVRSRTWSEFPAAPGPARGGTAICVSKSRIFRFGGFDGRTEVGGQLDFLHLEVETFDDSTTRGEISIRARGSWQSILEDNPDASSTEIPLQPKQEWPSPRSVASLQSVTVGGGREYLVLAFGETTPSSDGHAGAGKFLKDVWAFEAPPHGMTAASFTAAFMQAVGRRTGEGKWTKVAQLPYDEEEDSSLPAARGWLSSAPMVDLEEPGLLIWGGLSEDNSRLGDGWILRLV